MISLVSPAYNEQDNLVLAVERAIPVLDRISPHWEIWIVNDGSTDGTASIADALAERYLAVHVIHMTSNVGLGGALRAGFEAARGDVIAYCDSDLPYNMDALYRAYELLERDAVDMVSAYRQNRSAEGLRRLLYSYAYNFLVRRIFRLRVEDVNFSLKMFRRSVYEKAQLSSRGSFIDVELLLASSANGFRIAQFGVEYTPRIHGSSTLARPAVILEILRELASFARSRRALRDK